MHQSFLSCMQCFTTAVQRAQHFLQESFICRQNSSSHPIKRKVQPAGQSASPTDLKTTSRNLIWDLIICALKLLPTTCFYHMSLNQNLHVHSDAIRLCRACSAILPLWSCSLCLVSPLTSSAAHIHCQVQPGYAAALLPQPTIPHNVTLAYCDITQT